MRLRRAAGDEGIDDVNNGHRHEIAFVKIIEKKGTLDESLLLQESFAPGVKGKLMPKTSAIKGLLDSIPTAIRGIRTGKMRSLPKLIPGVHHKLPGDAQDHVKRIYEHAEEHSEELNLYIKGEEGDRARARRGGAEHARGWPPDRRRSNEGRLLARLRLARLHPRAARLDGARRRASSGSSWSTLDRANCCGAGVIAEHNQELADTLNARTFALAQQTGLSMMNICSTCQGAQSECQQRLDADTDYRAHINEALAAEGLEYVKGKDGFENKNFLWVLVEDYGLDKLARSSSSGRSTGLRVGPFYGCYILRPKHRLGYDEHPERDLYLEQVIEALGGEVVEYDGARKCCGFPVITMNRETSLRQAGTHVGDALDAGRRLPRHAVPALPPEPRHAAARGGEGRQPRPRPRGPAPAPARRPRARLRAEGARHEQAHRLDRLGRGAARRGAGMSDVEASPTVLPSLRPRSSRLPFWAISMTPSASI